MRAHRLHVLLKRRARCGLLWRCATFRQLRRRRGLSLKLAPALRMRGCYRGRFDCGAGVRQRQAWPGARGRSRKWVVRRACRASVGRCWAWASGIGRRATVARRRCLLAVELLLFARVQKFAPALLLLFAHLPRASSLMGRARAVGAGSGAREQFAALSPARAASVPARAPAAAARRNASLRCRLRLAAAQA